MAVHNTRRQKKLAKKKAAREQKRKELAIRNDPGFPDLAAMARRGTIVATAVSLDLWDNGLGYAWISRKLADGRVAFAAFMLDVWCLGVKDVYFDVDSASEVERVYREFGQRLPWRTVTPADLRALVRGAVEFAQLSGLAPHPDYRHVQAILEGIEGQTRESFVFGQNGKPYYVAGPDDIPGRCYQIAAKVAAAGGQLAIGVPAGSLGERFLVGDDEDEFWNGEDDG